MHYFLSRGYSIFVEALRSNSGLWFESITGKSFRSAAVTLLVRVFELSSSGWFQRVRETRRYAEKVGLFSRETGITRRMRELRREGRGDGRDRRELTRKPAESADAEREGENE